MNTIEIDDEVLGAINARVTGLRQTENDVLRRILGLQASPGVANRVASIGADSSAGKFSFLLRIIENDQYRRLKAVDKYCGVLNGLMKQVPEAKRTLLEFRRGKRRYFAPTEKAILEGGTSVTAREIGDSGMFAMVTLDNATKRRILSSVLTACAVPSDIVQRVVSTIADEDTGPNPMIDDLI